MGEVLGRVSAGEVPGQVSAGEVLEGSSAGFGCYAAGSLGSEGMSVGLAPRPQRWLLPPPLQRSPQKSRAVS